MVVILANDRGSPVISVRAFEKTCLRPTKLTMVENVSAEISEPPRTSRTVRLQFCSYWFSIATHISRLAPTNDQENREENSIGCRSRALLPGLFLFRK